MAELVTKYQQYAEYKNTGVSWIPEMPQGWQVTKLKYLIKNLESGVSVNAADYPKSEGEFGVLKTSCVYTREFRAEENKTVFEEELSRVKCPVRAGSIIISRMNTPDLVGAAVYVRENYSNLYLPDRLWQTVYNDDEAQSSKYLHYFMYLRGFRDQISNFAEGASSSMQSISKEDFLSINILLPTRDEQEGVANFLDHETAQIDTLIEKQQTLIKLLKEKRQAVISHAVTKGLNPDAPLKDSGVEWLGEVPEHWEIQPIKYAFKSLNFRRIPLSGEVRGERKGIFRYYGASGVIDYIDDYIFDESTVLVGEDGANLVSRSTPLAFSAHGKYWVNNHAHILEPKDSLADYWAEAIEHIDINPIVTGSAQPKLTAEALSNLKITFPTDLDERIKIDSYIKSRKENYNNLISKAQQAIQLMQERRIALISAAVMGKIDVRGWQATDIL